MDSAFWPRLGVATSVVLLAIIIFFAGYMLGEDVTAGKASVLISEQIEKDHQSKLYLMVVAWKMGAREVAAKSTSESLLDRRNEPKGDFAIQYADGFTLYLEEPKFETVR